MSHHGAAGEEPDCRAASRKGSHHDVRVLRRRLFLQGRNARRSCRAHGAEPGRPCEPGPCLRQGPLRVWLCDAPGPRAEAHDSRAHHGFVARGELGRGDQLRSQRVQTHSDQVRSRLRRRHHLVTLHERRGVPGTEARACGVRQQQRRHLRARMSFAHRLRAQAHARRIGRHTGIHLGHEVRCGPADRRESDRRTSGVRLAAQAASIRARSGSCAARISRRITTCSCVRVRTSRS